MAHGEFYYGRSSYPYFRITEFSSIPAMEQGAVLTPLVEVKKENGEYRIPKDSPFYMMAEILKVRNNSVVLQAAPDVETLPAFHQEQLSLTEGTFFSKEDYGEKKVCMISEQLAGVLLVQVGDSLEIGAVSRKGMDIYQSYYPKDGFDMVDTYVIKGIFKGEPDYNYYVYVPKDEETAGFI